MGWRPFLVLLFVCCSLVLTGPAAAGTPPAQAWNRTLGGNSDDIASAVQQTTDGGYVVAGRTYSNNGDVAGNHGGWDYWVVKLDAAGQMAWNRTLGGSRWDEAHAVQQTSDGGYVVAGFTYSNDGDVAGNQGSIDYWVVKLDAAGQMAWNRTLGGSSYDEAYAVTQTSDGGYVVAGRTYSNNGDVAGNHGEYDCWVVKLDADGQMAWNRTLGGSGNDRAYTMQQTSDGGYVIAGETQSNNGDVAGNHGGLDCWVVKLDADGNMAWNRTLGGSKGDQAYGVDQASDGGYVIAGKTYSNDGDVNGTTKFGGDLWVVKLDAAGQINWSRTFGGSGWDEARAVQQTSDGGYVVAGYTRSNNGDVAGNHGESDFWVVKLAADGEMAWNRTLGGSMNDYAYAVEQTGDGGYVIAGETLSNNGDVAGTHGRLDYWVVKLMAEAEAEPPVASFTTNVSSGPAPLTVLFTDTSTGEGITGRSWEFGDGSTSSEASPTHTFLSPGTYTVTLTVTNAGGSNTATQTVTATGTPAIDLEKMMSGDGGSTWIDADDPPGPYLREGTNPQFRFVVTNTGNVTLSNVGVSDSDFGPLGGIAALSAGDSFAIETGAPRHEGQHENTATVTGTFTYSSGKTETVSDTDLAHYYGITAPVAGFTANVTSGVIPLTVAFTNTSTGMGITSHSWEFGDGTTSSEANPVHTFAAPGTYTVTLTVTNAAGSDTATRTVTATGTPAIDLEVDVSVDGGSTWYDADTAPGPTAPVGSTVTWTYTVTNTGTVPLSGVIVTDDGGTATDPADDFTAVPVLAGGFNVGDLNKDRLLDTTETWSYSASALARPGQYANNGTATGTPPGGLAAVTAADPSHYYGLEGAVANFTATPSSGAAPLWVQFTDTSTGEGITGRSWTFGDGSTSSEASPIHTFLSPGTYTVNLTVTNAGGSDTATQTVTVATRPWIVAGFTMNATTGTAPLTVQFTDTSTGPVRYRSWDFGDGATSTEQNPVHVFTAPGEYTVRLLVGTGQSTDRHTETVSVFEEPPAVGGDTGYFLVSTQPAGAAIYLEGLEGTRYLQGTTSGGPVNVTIYLTGSPMKKIIANLSGYHDAVFAIPRYPPKGMTIPVGLTLAPAQAPPVANFTANATAGIAPLTVQFTDTSTSSPTQWHWVIDDTVYTVQHPRHTFTSPGARTVLLVATNAMGSSSAKVMTIDVAGAPPPTTEPTTEVTTPVTTPVGNHPYPSTHIVPGRVEAEDYDVTGGDLVAYYDTTAANEGGAYRTDGVDIEVGGSGYNVGWIRAGEFLTYTVASAAAGTYTIEFRVANPGAAKTVTVSVNGEAKTLTIPSTGGFQNWQTVPLTGVNLNSGGNLVRVSMGSAASFNVDYMDFTTGGSTQPTTVVTTTTTIPSTGGASFTAAPIPVKKSSLIRFTVTPAPGKTIRSAWWTFDKAGHYTTWNSRTVNAGFYYPATGTFTPLVKLTYTDGSTEEVYRTNYVTVT